MTAREVPRGDEPIGFGQRFLLNRTRWSVASAGVLYFLFGIAYRIILGDHIYDPLVQRALVSAISFSYVATTFLPRATGRWLSPLLITVVLAITAHSLFLVASNDVSMLYVLGAYCAMFASGVVLLSPRGLLVYYAFATLFTAELWWTRGDANSFFLFMGAVCAMVISFFSSAMVLSLLGRVEKSRLSLERTSAELADVNANMTAILDSLGQGLFTIGPDGTCGGVHSKACLALLGEAPAGRAAWDVLNGGGTSVGDVRDWVELAFASNASVRAAVLELGPRRLVAPTGLVITFDFHPVLGGDGRMREIVAVATDRTLEERSIESARAEAARVRMIASIVEHRASFLPFLRELTGGLKTFAAATSSPTLGADFRRFLHTMKGGCGVFAIDELARKIHELENEWTSGSSGDDVALVREQAARLNAAVEIFAREVESILGMGIVREQRLVEIPVERIGALIERVTEDHTLRADLIDLTLQPVGAYFKPYEVLTQRLAEQRQKDAPTVVMSGADLRLLPESYQDVFTAFVHVFRNIVDHGLELPAERAARGKSPGGTIEIRFEIATQNRLTITVTDDGRGVDVARLRTVLRAKGRDVENAGDADVIAAIFESDLSTRAEVTALSGRGVGLNALAVAAESLGGRVGARSTPGRGTTIWVDLPLVREMTCPRAAAA